MPIRSEAYRRHACYYLSLATEAAPHLRSAEQTVWLETLETAYDNLRAALVWSRSTHGDLEIGVRLATELGWFWILRDRIREGRDCLTLMLANAGSHIPDGVRAKAITLAGQLASVDRDPTTARCLLEESLALCRTSGDLAGVAINLLHLAGEETDLEKALSLYQQGLPIFRELNDSRGIAATLNNMGNVLYAQGEQDQARACYEQSLELKRQIGERRSLMMTLNNLGDFTFVRGEYEAADRYYKESLMTARELQSSGIFTSLSYLAKIAYCLGDHQAAYDSCMEALALQTQENNLSADILLEQLAMAAMVKGEAQRVVVLLSAADIFRETTGAPRDPDRVETLECARAMLDKQAFTKAWSLGQRLNLKQAVSYIFNI